MPLDLRYGIDSELRITNAAAVRLGLRLDVSDIDDVTAAARAALASPIDFPSLAQSVVPGDQIVLLLDLAVPHGAEIASAVAEQLIEAGIEADSITLLQAEPTVATAGLPVRTAAAVHAGEAKSGRRGGNPSQPDSAGRESPSHEAIGSDTGGHVRVVTHDPRDRNNLAYLTNTPSGKPIYLNRVLLDADMIVPIGVYRGDLAWSYRGVHGLVYPTFSDDAARLRYRNPHMLDSHDEVFAKSQREIDQVGRLAGMQFTVQVLPGEGDDVAGILAGETSAVARRAEAWWNTAWRNPRPDPAEVVVVTLTGSRSQTWSALGETLETAAALVEEGGSILVCSDLEQTPRPAFELLSQVDDRDEAVRHIRKDRPVDAQAALILAAAQEKARIYLLSRLDSSVVEEMGMSPIDDAADVTRFVAKRRTCTVVADGRHTSLAAEVK
jgi:hypothetical protein